MEKMELEVKILDIDKEKLIEKLESLGATLIKSSNQYLYVFDLPTIYSRYIDCLDLLNNNLDDERLKSTAVEKMTLLFSEFDNILKEEEKKVLLEITGCNKLTDILSKEDFLNKLNNFEFIQFVMVFDINKKKWIRLRQTKDKTTIAIKNILPNREDTIIQQMQETEIEVPSIGEGKEFLNALGYAHKSYMEKRRISYILDGYEIEIDTWPEIPTFMEVEGKSEKDISKILEKLRI